jgi:hypothetical protein
VETGAAVAIGVGALVVVFLITKQQEQQTAMLIAQQRQQQQGDGALSFRDGFAVLGTIAATYFGGPGAGAKAATALAA